MSTETEAAETDRRQRCCPEAEAQGRSNNVDDHDDHGSAEVEDNPKQPLLTIDSAAATAEDSDAPVWQLKRLRPAFASIGMLACFAACLTGCGPLVPDLLRELRELQPARPPTVSRLLNAHSQCVADLSSSAAGATYSADSTGARIAYAAACLQAVLACQLACLPAGLRRVAADRAAMLARLLSG